jgi:hypothetical protein
MSSRRESDFARLQRLLREANERAKEERKRAEEERKRAEDADERAKEARKRAQEANERVEQEQKRADEEQTKTRPTTFEEYIRTCHTLLSKPLRVQTDKSLSTQGSITSPTY